MRALSQLLQVPEGDGEPLLSGTGSALALRVEDALCGSRMELAAMNLALVNLVSKLSRKVAAPVSDVLFAPSEGEPALQQAFVMGQLSFAQVLVSQALNSRADDAFMPTVRHRAYRKYLQALRGNERSGNELSTVTGERPETVSRKLKRLRELGVTDFRKEGTVVLNFLTSAARAAMAAEAPDAA